MEKENKKGKVYLLGAGPGDYGLLTRKAGKIIAEADTIVYDALVSLEILASLPKEAEWIDVGKRSHYHKMPQEEINKLLLEKAKEGKKVVRLKGGDPFVFGRGGEELELLAKEGVPFEVVPGITSALAVPVYNGIPITHREYSSSFHVITGHKKKDGKLDIDFKALVNLDATLVFLMGLSELAMICKRLLENGMDPDMPAAVLEKGTGAEQRRVLATLATLQEAAEQAKMQTPAIILVGRVCKLAEKFAWFEKKPLFGRKILNTRPRQAKGELSQSLRSLGAEVIEYPTIETLPLRDYEEAYQEMLQEKRPVCLSFTSARGVEYFFEELKRKKHDLRELLSLKNLSFAAIGKATARALEAYGIFADYMPEEYSAEALGILLAEKWEKDGIIYLYRAEEGAKSITSVLEAKKMPYRDIPIYRTIYREKDSIQEKIAQAFLDGEIREVTFTSASTVKGFVFSFSELNFREIRAFCIGKQTAMEAEKFGFQIKIAKEATMEAMVDLFLEEDN
jgi:uroporphyrinogen III methyltransferase / synthase